ncbi:hypothetical protein LTR62_000765 [Meristemomyces frigidus]|uniref:AB hydrolase-1 domain-containing protein n=1 Tax=Meristemomyces frigidus TaxID=1508187 RepID=A0AAN7TU27_9PEZI|nr:hypothetical protein LTR62_000765 [Meristemomyces frigidus]
MTHLSHGEFTPLPLPDGLEDDYVDCTSSCGLKYHVIRAGQPTHPLILFCHGYPELAFSWRKIMPAIAAQGYYCIAMDQRGYGRTTGNANDASYEDTDLSHYTMTNLVRDLVCLVYRLGYKKVHCIIGHDFGGVSSAMAALMRPDIFQSTIQMSHPHHAAPLPPFGPDATPKQTLDIQAELAKLNPPRKHYKYYNSTPTAAHDWNHPSQGLGTFLRGYFHLKSGDWEPNNPHPLKEWSAQALEEMPEYYIMRREHSMPQTVQTNMSNLDPTKTESWLPASDLKIYVQEWSRTGFGAALSWYRAQTASTPESAKDMLLFAGRRIEVPCMFISGSRDWGNYQQPGAFEGYESAEVVGEGCFRGCVLVEGAGHWVQQEKAEEVVGAVKRFLEGL